MHELSLAQSLVEQILSAAGAENATRVLRVVIAIGPYSGVDKSAFEFAFPFAAEGTMAEGAELVIDGTTAMIDCTLCHASTQSDHPAHLICPACGSENVIIKGGHEFLLRKLELNIAPD